MLSSNDKRSEFRLKENVTIFVEICSAAHDNSSPANIIICHSLDVSANGILVEMDQAVAVGSILRLCVDIHGTEHAIYLVGEAKWVEQQGSSYNVGFELYEAENTDIVDWKQLIAQWLDQNAAQAELNLDD